MIVIRWSQEAKWLIFYVPEQVGMNAEALNLQTVSGSSSIEWVEGDEVMK